MSADQFPLTMEQVQVLGDLLIKQTRVYMEAMEVDLGKTYSFVVILHPDPSRCSIKVISS